MHGRNLIGAEAEINYDNVINRIFPVGQNEDGTALYLNSPLLMSILTSNRATSSAPRRLSTMTSRSAARMKTRSIYRRNGADGTDRKGSGRVFGRVR